MEITFSNIKISGIASALPENIVEVESFSEIFGEKKIKRIKKSTGVERMHILSQGQTASDLCIVATKKLIKALDYTSDSIDGVIFSSFSPDYKAPSTSSILLDKLKLSANAVAFDINFGCSAFVFGLYQACMLIAAGGCKRVLLLNGDAQSLMINPKDRAMRMILGDGSAATIIERGEDTLNFSLKFDGSGYDKLIIPAGGYRQPSSEKTREEFVDADGNTRCLENLFMDGMAIMKFALTEVPLAVDKVLSMMGKEKSDIDLFAFHQPNKLILDYLGNDMGIDEKMPIGLKNTGNTASASIPILLSTLKKDGHDFSKDKNVIACGFGIGLSIAAVNLNLSKTVVVE